MTSDNHNDNHNDNDAVQPQRKRATTTKQVHRSVARRSSTAEPISVVLNAVSSAARAAGQNLYRYG